MKPKLYGLTVARDEADRYLASMLANVKEVVDAHFFYDDWSEDDTLKIAEEAGCVVVRRPATAPSFLEHEGRFRQNAYNDFELFMSPRPGDWVLAIDADETLVTTGEACCTRCEIDQAIELAEATGATSVKLPVPEVFGFDDDGTPLVRTDGLWGTIAGTRLFKYVPNARYRDKSMGCGAEPVVVTEKWSPTSYGLHLLHYGYAHEPDQVAKHARYTSLLDHGHDNAHVKSIVGPKTLKRWHGPVPVMTRAAA